MYTAPTPEWVITCDNHTCMCGSYYALQCAFLLGQGYIVSRSLFLFVRHEEIISRLQVDELMIQQ